jgi:hypothetical protein
MQITLKIFIQKIKYLETSKHVDERIFSRLKGGKKKKFLTKSV